MRRLTFAAVAVLLMGSLPGQAAAQAAHSPAGDWVGDLTTPTGTYRLGVHIDEKGPGAFTGTLGSHDTGRWGSPLAPVTATGDALSFTAPSSNASFKGVWDPAGSAYAGTYTSVQGTFPMTFKAGIVPPAPTVAGLDGRWEGEFEGFGIGVVVRIATGDHGTMVQVDFPSQGRTNMVGKDLKRDGQAVSFTAAGPSGFKGALSADGASLAGTWTQMGNDLPITLKKKPAV